MFLITTNTSWKSSPSPTEIAAIISQAKQASASVLIAQQQVQAAKENVLLQQKLASEKESQAAIALQKTEVRFFFVKWILKVLIIFCIFRLLQVKILTNYDSSYCYLKNVLFHIAIQRQESASAAQTVVLAQQRLANAKSNYAQQQKFAAAKEVSSFFNELLL